MNVMTSGDAQQAQALVLAEVACRQTKARASAIGRHCVPASTWLGSSESDKDRQAASASDYVRGRRRIQSSARRPSEFDDMLHINIKNKKFPDRSRRAGSKLLHEEEFADRTMNNTFKIAL